MACAPDEGSDQSRLPYRIRIWCKWNLGDMLQILSNVGLLCKHTHKTLRLTLHPVIFLHFLRFLLLRHVYMGSFDLLV